MFNKLLSNLPYNPGLISQVSFYSKRLQAEASVRRFAFIFMIFALIVQTAAALYPPEKSLAASPNHILNGITDKGSLLRAWDSNTGNIQGIYGKFGVTRENIAAIPGRDTNTTIVSNGANWWSIGRLPLSNYGISGSQWSERKIIADGSTVYQRPLKAWDKPGTSSKYPAFQGVNKHGVAFWILKDCGNLTFKSPYTPAPPKPDLEVHKTLLTSNSVKPGDTVKYRIDFRNPVPESLAIDFRLRDNLDGNLVFKSLPGLTKRVGNDLYIEQKEFGHTPNWQSRILTATVKAGVPHGTVICNEARISADVVGLKFSPEKPCITVINPPKVPTPTKPTPPTTPTQPEPSCPAGQTKVNGKCQKPEPKCLCVVSTSFVEGSNKDIRIKTQSHVEGDTKVTGYSYDINDDGSIEQTTNTSSNTDEKIFKGLTPGLHKVRVTITATNGQKQTSKSCLTEVTVSEDARVVQTKKVTNVSKQNSDAVNTTVNSGETLKFELTTENVTNSDYKNYSGEDYFGDVLDYAEIIDQQELTRQGLTLDSSNYLRWSVSSIKAKSKDVKVVTVKVKSVIPATNRPSNASQDQDCVISNRYGNEVKMNVGCPIIKTIEQATGKLPNTGPGTNMAVTVIATILIGYFFARSRLLSREIEILRADYTSAGGMA